MADKKKFDVEVDLTINTTLTVVSESAEKAMEEVQELDFDTLTSQIYQGGCAGITDVKPIDVMETDLED
jgi:formyltetrahydrofolate synthetase